MNTPDKAAVESPGRVVKVDSLTLLRSLPDESVDLIYTDPPFNTGKRQRAKRLRAAPDGEVLRPGFDGRERAYEIASDHAYDDDAPFDEFLAWLKENLVEMHRVLTPTGSLYLHLDWHAVHYAAIALDEIFGRKRFRGEIIWAYDFGGRPRNAWPRKHDTILWYTKSDTWTFNRDDMDRLPYLAPSLVGPEKAARGKLPTDVWVRTIVPTASLDRTGWPTQKPIEIIERIVKASSNPGELCLDPFVGSGTSAVAFERLGRRYIVGDMDAEAVRITTRRLERSRLGLPYRDPGRRAAKSEAK